MADELQNMTLTVAGYNLMARAINGEELHLSRVVFGDGELPEGVNLKDLTALYSPKMELPIINKRIDGVGTCVLSAQIVNANVEEGFFAREVGVFATDMTNGEEVLYAVRNTGIYSEWIPASSSGVKLNHTYDIMIVVAQAENITVELSEPIGGISRAEFYEHTNDTENPHPGFLQHGGNVSEFTNFYVTRGNKAVMDRASIPDVRKALLGNNVSTLPIMNGRLSQLEIEMANLGIRMDAPPNLVVGAEEPKDKTAVWLRVPTYYDTEYANSIFVDLDLSNMAFYDNFAPVEEVETLRVAANAITAGSRTIGVATLDGIKQGQWLTVTDGISSEEIQVKSSSRNDGILRIITTQDIVNTYRTESTVILRTTANTAAKVIGAAGKQGVQMNAGESIVSLTHEFSEDGIGALAFAQAMIHHDALTAGRLRAYVTFGDEVKSKENVVIGTTTGQRQTIQLPDTGVDYNTIEIKVGGVKFVDFSANTEPSHPEITLTAEEAGQEITASYRYGYGMETWNEMTLTSQQNYSDSGRTASKFEYALPEGQMTSTRTAIKFVYESDTAADSTVVYAVEMGWAKATDIDA